MRGAALLIMSLLACRAVVPLRGQLQDSGKRPRVTGDRQVALWLDIRRELLGPRGSQYFEEELKDAYLPGGANGVSVLKGTLISSTPAQYPNEFLVAMPGSVVADVTLKLKGRRFAKPVAAGTALTFRGIPIAFTSNPFMLTFEVEQVDLLSEAPKKAAPPRPRAKQ
jgi:hypothetical protein